MRPARCRVIFILSFLVLLVVATAAIAQEPPSSAVPLLVRFTGTLPGADGDLAATFALYEEPSGGEPLWSETQVVHADAGGHYTVLLGAATSGGLAQAIGGGTARWIGVRVGEVELPRTLLTSVPYAIKAEDAATISGRPLSAFVLKGETTGLGPDGLTYVNPRSSSAGLAGALAPTANAGTANYLGMFTNGTDLANSVVYQAGTKIGVNTAAPEAPFHSVSTDAPNAFFDVIGALGALPVVYRAARGTPLAPAALQVDDILGGLAVRGHDGTAFSQGRGQVMFRAAQNWTPTAHGTYLSLTTTALDSTAWAERMRIDPAGNVGIGTTTPAQKLSVAGTIESTIGGFRFPDGTSQTTASTGSTSYSAGAGLSLTGNVFSVNFAGTGAATNVARSDHTHPAPTGVAGDWSVGGNLLLPATTASSGMVRIGNSPFVHAFGNVTNVFVGGAAGGALSSTGGNNTAVGASALFSNGSGASNSALGYESLRDNTSGAYNSAFGAGALRATTGTANSAFGTYSLFSNQATSNNSAFGAWSLYSNTGADNSAFGYQSLMANTTGTGNSAFGLQSLWSNTTASQNSAFGRRALHSNVEGINNSAFGFESLYSNTGGANSAFGSLSLRANAAGNFNSAFGAGSLAANTTGSSNTAYGSGSLNANTTSSFSSAFGAESLLLNTAVGSSAFGYQSLRLNTTGYHNSAVGYQALAANATASHNTAIGYQALQASTSSFNTAVGSEALKGQTTGSWNTAMGYQALQFSSLGANNTAVGTQALQGNTEGDSNTGVGGAALVSNHVGIKNSALGMGALAYVTGSNNIGLGWGAGISLTTGNDNIAIGDPGVAAESGTIRIGTPGVQTHTLVAGIYGATIIGAGQILPVGALPNGQLFTTSSSRRVKDHIADMGTASSKLMQLRPVTFYYTGDNDPAGRTLQYGLVAEEVADVYPGLVAHSTDGQIVGVMYQALPPMLLNEYQKQQRTIEALRERLTVADEQSRRLGEQVEALRAIVEELRRSVSPVTR